MNENVEYITNKVLIEQSLYKLNGNIGGDDYILECIDNYLENSKPKYKFSDLLSETLQYSKYKFYLPILETVDTMSVYESDIENFDFDTGNIKPIFIWYNKLSSSEKKSSIKITLRLIYECMKNICRKYNNLNKISKIVETLKNNIKKVESFELCSRSFINSCPGEYLDILAKELNISDKESVYSKFDTEIAKNAVNKYLSEVSGGSYKNDLQSCIGVLLKILSTCDSDIVSAEIIRYKELRDHLDLCEFTAAIDKFINKLSDNKI